MRLSDILSPTRAKTDCEPGTKAEALGILARLFAGEDPALDAEAVLRVFEEREKLASTGVGSGVAIPHGRLEALDDLRAAVAVVPDGVAFEAIDGRPVRILIAVLSPRRQSGVHLKALARISRILRDEGVRRRILEAHGPEAVIEILVGADRSY